MSILRENIEPEEWERDGYQTRLPESRWVLPGRECFGNVSGSSVCPCSLHIIHVHPCDVCLQGPVDLLLFTSLSL